MQENAVSGMQANQVDFNPIALCVLAHPLPRFCTEILCYLWLRATSLYADRLVSMVYPDSTYRNPRPIPGWWRKISSYFHFNESEADLRQLAVTYNLI